MLINENELILLAKKVTERYVSKGVIPTKEKEDVEMAMIEKFLNQEQKIAQSFQGTAKINTYCIAILNRMCCEIIRKELKHWKSFTNTIDIATENEFVTSKSTLINNEVHYLEQIINMYGDAKHKINLFLTVYFGLAIIHEDLELFDNSNKLRHDVKQLESLHKNKGEIFEVLAEISNLIEGKSNKPDAIRIWLNKTINSIIARLNNPFARANYSKETLQVLYEHYHAKRMQQNSMSK